MLFAIRLCKDHYLEQIMNVVNTFVKDQDLTVTSKRQQIYVVHIKTL